MDSIYQSTAVSQDIPTSQKRPFPSDLVSESHTSPKYYRVDVHFPGQLDSTVSKLAPFELDVVHASNPKPYIPNHNLINIHTSRKVEKQNSACPLTGKNESNTVHPLLNNGNLNDDEENESIMRVMSQHAEHRGPREVGVVSDSMAVRYFRSRTWRGNDNNSNNHGHNNGNGSQTTSSNRGMPMIPISADYVCHMCGEKGHHIKLCPKKQGRKQGKKVRSATGIPRSWLQLIDPDKTNEYENVYCLPNGHLAVLKPEAARGTTQSRDMRTTEAIHEDLKCRICHKVFTEATSVSCCGSTFCKRCITSLTTAVNTYCPACGYFPFRMVDLEPNVAVQDSVSAMQMPAAQLLPSPSSGCRTVGDKETRSRNIPTVQSKEESILHFALPAKIENHSSGNAKLDASLSRQSGSTNKWPINNAGTHSRVNNEWASKNGSTGPMTVLSFGKPFTASEGYRPPFSFGLHVASQPSKNCNYESEIASRLVRMEEPNEHNQPQSEQSTNNTGIIEGSTKVSVTVEPHHVLNNVALLDSHACVHDGDDNEPKADIHHGHTDDDRDHATTRNTPL